MFELFRMLRPYGWRIALVTVLLTGQSIANLYLPDLNADIINNGIARGDTDYILLKGGAMLLVSLGLACVSVLPTYFSAIPSLSYGRDMLALLYRHDS